MEVKFKLDEKKIKEEITNAIHTKVVGLVWSKKDLVTKKLLEKYTPSELDEFKEESKKAFKEAIKREVQNAVHDYPQLRNSKSSDVYDQALNQIREITRKLKEQKDNEERIKQLEKRIKQLSRGENELS